MTWTWALMTKVFDTVKPSSTLFSSMNFFQPQSCSFLQNLWSVSAQPLLHASDGSLQADTGMHRTLES